MVQLLSMGLDFLDALSGAVAIAYWWCIWVRPAKQPHPPEGAPVSGRAEIDRFLRKARSGLTFALDSSRGVEVVPDVDAAVVLETLQDWK